MNLKPILTASVVIMASFLEPSPVSGQSACTRDAMVVFDGSGSMAEMGFNRLDEPRIFDARRAVRKVMPQIAPLRRIGLITYGALGAGESCQNIELRFSPIPNATDRMISEIDKMQPEGETPLTEAISEAAEVLDYENKPGVIVLVTDGQETCGGAPCELAAELAAGFDLTVHVIGFRVRGPHFVFDDDSVGSREYHNAQPVARCLADRTGGQYVRAETLNDLIGALRQTLGCRVISELHPQSSLSLRRVRSDLSFLR